MTTEQFASKDSMLREIDGMWGEYLRRVDAVDAGLLETPGPFGWSIKDVMANIMGWEQEVIALMRDQPPPELMGIDAATYEDGYTDVINSRLYELHRREPYAVVRSRAEATHAELRDLCEQRSWAELTAPVPSDPASLPAEDRSSVLDWVAAATISHYRDHFPDIDVIATAAEAERSIA